MRRFLITALLLSLSGAVAVGAGNSGAATRSLAAGTGTHRLAVAVNPADPAVTADGTHGFDAVWINGSQAITKHWSAQSQGWGAGMVLSSDARAGDGTAAWVAGSGSGAAVAAWTARHGVEVRYRISTAGPWQPGMMLMTAVDPQVGIDARGDGYVVWSAHGQIMLAEHPAGAGDWDTPVSIVRGRQARVAFLGGPELAVSPAGTVAVAWDHVTGQGPTIGGGSPSMQRTFTRGNVLLRTRLAGATRWRKTVMLGPVTELPLQGDADRFPGSAVNLAINRRDRVFVAWQFREGQRFYPRVATVSERPGPTPVRTLTLPHQATTPVIAASDSSALVLAGTASRWITATGQLGATLPAQALRTGASNESVAAADPQGDFVLAGGGGTLLDPARHICQQFSASASANAAAIAPNGNAIVIWQQASTTRTRTPIFSRTLSCRATDGR